MSFENIDTLPALNSKESFPNLSEDIQKGFKEFVLSSMIQYSMENNTGNDFTDLPDNTKSSSEFLKDAEFFSLESIEKRERELKKFFCKMFAALLVSGMFSGALFSWLFSTPIHIQIMSPFLSYFSLAPALIYYTHIGIQRAIDNRRVSKLLGLENGVSGLQYNTDFDIFEKDPRVLCQFIANDFDNVLERHTDIIVKKQLELKKKLMGLHDLKRTNTFLIEKGDHDIPNNSYIYEDAINEGLHKWEKHLQEINEFRSQVKEEELALQYAMNESLTTKEISEEFEKQFGAIEVLLIQNDTELEVREMIVGKRAKGLLLKIKDSQQFVSELKELSKEDDEQALLNNKIIL